MFPTFHTTLIGILRDRIFHAIGAAGLLLACLPAVSTFSMRQVPVLATTLSLSLTAALLLLLAVFLGATCLWRDVDRRYAICVLGLPLSRSSYLLGRFSGVACVLVLTTLVLAGVSIAIITVLATNYPAGSPFAPLSIIWAFAGLSLKYILLTAVGFLLATQSTSFFLPVFGTIGAFLAGNTVQDVYLFLQTGEGRELVAPWLKPVVEFLHVVLPNFSVFDLSTQAAYGLPVTVEDLLWMLGYFVVYTGVVITLAALLFNRREFK